MTDWFERLTRIVNRHEPRADAHALPRAAAVLLIEMAMADQDGGSAELEVIHRAIAQAFDIGAEELSELIEEAHARQAEAVSLHEYTRTLRAGMKPQARAELVEWLWRVAFADGRIDRHEEHLVRRLADLLGVNHREFIRRKHRAEQQRPRR